MVEITVPMGNNVILRSEAEDENLFLAIDHALAKMERQIRKHRTKLGKRLREDAFSEVPEFIEEEEPEEKELKVVRRKTFPVRPMSVEDAAIEMEMLGHSFFAFVNIDTERTNILYLGRTGTWACSSRKPEFIRVSSLSPRPRMAAPLFAAGLIIPPFRYAPRTLASPLFSLRGA